MSIWLKGYACLITNDYQGATKYFMQFSSSTGTAELLDYANELARKNPENAVAQMLKGDALARNGKYNKSLSALDVAVQLDPQSALIYDVRGVVRALAYNARGVLYNNLKAWEQSEADFSKAKELLPELSFVSGNQRLLSWTIGQEQFKIARMAENQGDGRGATLLASTYERYSVDIGDGRTVDVFNIKNTPQTATLSGMETTLRHITNKLRTEAKLPEDWKPNILIAQPGLGSSAYAERRNFAKMAFSSGKDFVISTDTTDKFQWGIKAPIIDEDVARRIERTVVASNRVFGSAPDLLVESQASRLLGKPQHGSVTLSSLFEQGKLHTDFKVNRCITVGVPFYDMKVNDQLKSDRFKDIVSFSTKYTMTGIVPNAPLPGISNIELTFRGLTDHYRDAVLIGCKDTKLGEMMKAQFGDAWRVEVVSETDPTKLSQLALTEKFTHINLVTDRQIKGITNTTGINSIKSVPGSLPEVRSLVRNIDRFNDATRLIYKLADAEMPNEMKVPLAFASPVTQDIKALQNGQYNFLTSQTFERIGRFGMKELPGIVNTLKQQGKLPTSFNLPPAMAGLPDIVAGASSQIGRGKLSPSVDEVTNYLDGINKASWAIVGAMIAGPKGASIASTSAGLAADTLREITRPQFEKWACTPVRRQMIQNWRIHVEAASDHGVPAKTFSEMFGPQFVKQVGFDQKTVAELDKTANRVNMLGSTGRQQTVSQYKLPDSNIRNSPVITTPRQDEIWKKYSGFPPPPPGGGGASIPATNYRIPSSAVSGVKPGGVLMKTDVVKGKQADMSEMFGTDAGAQSETQIQQQGLICPFLLFCALPSAVQ